MKDDNKWVRRAASGALSNLGESAVEPLIKTLDDDVWRVRGGAAWALSNIKSPEALDPLIEVMGDDSGFVRAGAVMALGNIGGEKAEKALQEALEDKSGYVRRVAQGFLNKD
jgi:HEAT repeat protein